MTPTATTTAPTTSLDTAATATVPSTRRRPALRTFAAVAALGGLGMFGLAACGADEGDFQSQAASFIRGKEVTEKLGFQIKESTCQKPSKVEKGVIFTCDGTAEDGQQYVFTVEITGDKSFLVTSYEPKSGAAGATGDSGVTGVTEPVTAGTGS